MLSTVILGAEIFGLIVGSILLWAFLLWVGLRGARVSEITFGRIALATIAVYVVQLALTVAYLLIPIDQMTQTLLGLVSFLVATIVVPFIVIERIFKTPPRRTLTIWLPTFLAPILMTVFIVLVIRPFVFEAFVIPTNAMAPTILGHHWQATCPTCGSPAYFSPPDERARAGEPRPMICRDSFHVTESVQGGEATPSNDRILVAKFLQPRRWDIIVFSFPENPSVSYVKRLVGLPGEEITIRDGMVWADGVALTPPEHLSGLEYLDEIPYPIGPIWGSPDRPAQLADNEYFVLGDFSQQSADSRLWEVGAPGYHPYAVPESYIKGVVTHIYWPISRWRILR